MAPEGKKNDRKKKPQVWSIQKANLYKYSSLMGALFMEVPMEKGGPEGLLHSKFLGRASGGFPPAGREAKRLNVTVVFLRREG